MAHKFAYKVLEYRCIVYSMGESERRARLGMVLLLEFVYQTVVTRIGGMNMRPLVSQ